MEMAEPLRLAVGVMDAVNVADTTMVGELVKVALAVDVATTGVEVATPITTGVGVNMDGVDVTGKNGVGPGNGWITQPLQDDSRNISRNMGLNFFMIFSSFSIVSLLLNLAKSPVSVRFKVVRYRPNSPISFDIQGRRILIVRTPWHTKATPRQSHARQVIHRLRRRT